VQLYNVPRTEDELQVGVGEANVPGALRRRPLHDELDAYRSTLAAGGKPKPVWFDAGRPVLRVVADGAAVPTEAVSVCDLSDATSPPPEGWRRPSAPIEVSVDPVLGRLAFRAGVVPTDVEVDYSYAFSGDLGGGPYDRRASVAEDLPDPTKRPVTWQRGVSKTPSADPLVYDQLGKAVAAWNATAQTGTVGVIAIMDSRTYAESVTIQVPAGSRLLIVAADWPQRLDPLTNAPLPREPGVLTPKELRPLVEGTIAVKGTAPKEDPDPGRVALDGLLIQGHVRVRAGNLGGLRVAHSTLVPASRTRSLTAANGPAGPNDELLVELERTISGAIRCADTIRGLSITESIVDAGNARAIRAPATTIERSTILGSTAARTLSAGNSILTGPARAERRQEGCVRFCWLPLDSVVPRRYRCLPADAASAGRVEPAFTSTKYGNPAYCQLAVSCPVEILTGAEDEGEQGAFNFLQQTARLGNLAVRVDEHLRFGLEAGTFFAT